MNLSKFLSRKFLMMVAALVVDIGVGLGYNLDAKLISEIAAGIAALYIIIEGAIDYHAVEKK